MNQQIKNVLNFMVCIMCGVTLYMNLYKISFINSLSEDSKYPIFPWQPNPQYSKSSFEWLQLHMIVGMIHVLVSGIITLNRTIDLVIIQFFTHFLFTLIVLPNIMNFGEASLTVSIFFNLTPLILINVLYFNHMQYLYFFVLTSPVLLETYLYVKFIVNNQ